MTQDEKLMSLRELAERVWHLALDKDGMVDRAKLANCLINIANSGLTRMEEIAVAATLGAWATARLCDREAEPDKFTHMLRTICTSEGREEEEEE